MQTSLHRCVPDMIRDQSDVLTNRWRQFLEVQAQHAFIRDESSKGRWDAALTRSLFSFMIEVFERTVGRDLGPRDGALKPVEHVC